MVIPSIGIIVVTVGALLALLAVDWVVGGLAYANRTSSAHSRSSSIDLKEAA